MFQLFLFYSKIQTKPAQNQEFINMRSTPTLPHTRVRLVKKITKTRAFFSLVVLSTLALLVGCAPQKTGNVQISAQKKEDTRVLKQIEKLQEMAMESFRKDLLTTPDKENAYYFYQEILLLDPSNEIAKRGLEQIVERYLAWAINAAYEKQPAKARSYIARSSLVDKTHPSIGPTLKQVQIINGSVYEKLVFSPEPVLQDEETIGRLGSFIKNRSIRPRCRYLISGTNDQLVRKIYNLIQLAYAAKSDEAGRVRARNQISTPNRIERWCHPSF